MDLSMSNRNYDRWRYRIGECTGFECRNASLLKIRDNIFRFPLLQSREDIKGHANIQLSSALTPISCTGLLIPLRSLVSEP